MNPYGQLAELARSALRIPGAKLRAPEPGELAVGMSVDRTDPDAIGIVEWHGFASFEDGGPTVDFHDVRSNLQVMSMREVWDIRPLNPDATLNAHGVQRWENAEFLAVPSKVVVTVPVQEAAKADTPSVFMLRLSRESAMVNPVAETVHATLAAAMQAADSASGEWQRRSYGFGSLQYWHLERDDRASWWSINEYKVQGPS